MNKTDRNVQMNLRTLLRERYWSLSNHVNKVLCYLANNHFTMDVQWGWKGLHDDCELHLAMPYLVLDKHNRHTESTKHKMLTTTAIWLARVSSHLDTWTLQATSVFVRFNSCKLLTICNKLFPSTTSRTDFSTSKVVLRSSVPAIYFQNGTGLREIELMKMCQLWTFFLRN